MSLLEGPVPQHWWPTSWLSLRAFTTAEGRSLTAATTLCTADRGLRMNHDVWLVHAVLSIADEVVRSSQPWGMLEHYPIKPFPLSVHGERMRLTSTMSTGTAEGSFA